MRVKQSRKTTVQQKLNKCPNFRTHIPGVRQDIYTTIDDIHGFPTFFSIRCTCGFWLKGYEDSEVVKEWNSYIHENKISQAENDSNNEKE